MDLNWSNVLTEAYKNSSGYLLISIVVAIGSTLFVWICEKQYFNRLFKKKSQHQIASEQSNEEPEESESGEGMMGRVDVRSLAEQIAAEMTPEQREQEKAVEKQQLAAILKLLTEQEDSSHVSNMQYLEEQLSLYR